VLYLALALSMVGFIAKIAIEKVVERQASERQAVERQIK
jgi:multisubunit Na+/H+ antiporter MnhF subunit